MATHVVGKEAPRPCHCIITAKSLAGEGANTGFAPAVAGTAVKVNGLDVRRRLHHVVDDRGKSEENLRGERVGNGTRGANFKV